MSAENNSIKRRKVDGSASTDACCLTDLPKEALIHVATFLAAPSRALFAASLDGSSGSSDENVSAIFPSNQLIGSGGSVNFREISAQLDQSHVQKILWEMEALNQTDILDFGKISKKYVVQLSDDGIKTLLLCVDAVNTVRRLMLANCIGITGVGLEPLRGSTMIEQIDLSLVGYDEYPQSLDPDPPLSYDDSVLPILDSIISQDGCSLMYLKFPSRWRRDRGPQFTQFNTRYNQMLRSRGDSCNRCNEAFPRKEEQWYNACCTCYECLKHYCEGCGDMEDGNDNLVIRCCQYCDRIYCYQCDERTNQCNDCKDDYCVSCVEIPKCVCGKTFCFSCATYCYGCDKCFCDDYECNSEERSRKCCECGTTICSDCQPDFCWKCEGEDCDDNLFCTECNDEIGAKAVKNCEDCDTHYCGSCRVRSCQGQEKEAEEEEVCTGCIKLAHPFLIEENKNFRKKIAELKDVINKQK